MISLKSVLVPNTINIRRLFNPLSIFQNFLTITRDSKESAAKNFIRAGFVGRVRSKMSDIPTISPYALGILVQNRHSDRILVNDSRKTVLYVPEESLGVLDARTHEEFARGHICGAYLMPHDATDKRLEKFILMSVKQGHEIFVLYCNQTHNRSIKLAKRILEVKKNHAQACLKLEVYVLDGALKEYAKTDPLVDINMRSGTFSSDK